MKKTLLPFLFLFAIISANAQTWDWAKRAGGTGQDNCRGIVADAAGNSYIGGTFTDSADFGNFHLTAQIAPENMYVAKYDVSGNVVWVKQIRQAAALQGLSLNDIAIDDDANIYVTGYFFGKIYFDNDSLVSNGQNDMFVAKYDSSGSLRWKKRAGGSSYDSGDKIAVSKTGEVFVSGMYTD